MQLYPDAQHPPNRYNRVMQIFQVGTDESLAAIKHQGEWHFFCDMDYMFLLDIISYEGEEPDAEHPRFGTAIVTPENAIEWMSSLAYRLTIEQVANASYITSGHPAKLVFMVDFDQKLWVGSGWHNDQSFLRDYQPEGWITKEDDPYIYLPIEFITTLRPTHKR